MRLMVKSSYVVYVHLSCTHRYSVSCEGGHESPFYNPVIFMKPNVFSSPFEGTCIGHSMKSRQRLKVSIIITFFLYSSAIFILTSQVWFYPMGSEGNDTTDEELSRKTTKLEASTVLKSDNKEKRALKPEPKILTLFTTYNVSMESSFVYENTVSILSTFLPEVNLILFIPEDDIPTYAPPKGWTVLPVSATDCGETPVLKNMFFDAYRKFDTTFYGYANADILFNKGLLDTLYRIKHSTFYKGKRPVLISGKRIDLYLDKIKETQITTQDDVETLVHKGSVAYGYAEDYFITTKKYPWKHIPSLVIGRPKYDNFLVYMSRQRNVLVIDASMTVVALHQRTKKRKKSKDECNERILKDAKKFNMKYIKRGNLECAMLETRYNRDGNISIIRRGQFTTVC